jgi:plasmid stability protein
MAQITIRKLPDAVHRALRSKAAREGISAEEQARRILAAQLLPEGRPLLGDRLCQMAHGIAVPDDAFPRDRSGIVPPDFR